MRGDEPHGLRHAQGRRPRPHVLYLSCVIRAGCRLRAPLRPFFTGCFPSFSSLSSLAAHFLDNMELALEWLETQRAVMEDPTTANYFLQYTDGLGNKNGTIYNEPIEFGSQFFWVC